MSTQDELSKEVAKFELAVSQACRTGKFGKADSAKADFLAYLADREQSIKEQAAEKWKSFCGCPMCEHHSSAYSFHSTNNSLEEK